MLAPRISLLPAPSQRKRRVSKPLPSLKLSCLSFCDTIPLFSMACSLFSQKTRGWGTLLHLEFRHSPLATAANAFRISFYADSASKSFIYRFYAKYRGCWVPLNHRWPPLAYARCLLKGIAQLQHAPIIMVPPNNLYPD